MPGFVAGLVYVTDRSSETEVGRLKTHQLVAEGAGASEEAESLGH